MLWRSWPNTSRPPTGKACKANPNGVGQMLGIAKKEATAGPPLPFGPMVIGATK
jgi:hypothetical protein